MAGELYLNKVELIKSNMQQNEIIKEHSIIARDGNYYIGDTDESGSPSATLLNVSNYKNIGILIENNSDVSLTVYGIRIYKDGSGLAEESKRLHEVLGTSETIASGASKYYNAVDYPFLKDGIFKGFYVWVNQTTPTSGTIDVVFMGGNSL